MKVSKMGMSSASRRRSSSRSCSSRGSSSSATAAASPPSPPTFGGRDEEEEASILESSSPSSPSSPSPPPPRSSHLAASFWKASRQPGASAAEHRSRASKELPSARLLYGLSGSMKRLSDEVRVLGMSCSAYMAPPSSFSQTTFVLPRLASTSMVRATISERPSADFGSSSSRPGMDRCSCRQAWMAAISRSQSEGAEAWEDQICFEAHQFISLMSTFRRCGCLPTKSLRSRTSAG
mmetsp:Transcript_65187/g.212360  ORF Transcript_65187/g.212360 Transcript_65187/m.212360 type:complete len:236 (+) Transcript_65187:192-899(+)